MTMISTGRHSSLASLLKCFVPRSTFVHNQISTQRNHHLPIHWSHSGALRAARSFSITSSTSYPRRRGRIIFEPTEDKSFVDPGQSLLGRLERAGGAIAKLDDHHKKELGADKPPTEYIKHVLVRLQPILQYSSYHPDAQVPSCPHIDLLAIVADIQTLFYKQFLKAYAPQGSSINRAREASVYLFVSAQGWLSLATTAAKSRSENLDPEISGAAERFSKVVTMIEEYLEDKLPHDAGWSDVGAGILSASRDAWVPMYNFAVEDINNETEEGDTPRPEGGERSDKDTSSQSSA